MINIQSTQQLGQALRSARKQLGLTQSELALAAGDAGWSGWLAFITGGRSG